MVEKGSSGQNRLFSIVRHTVSLYGVFPRGLSGYSVDRYIRGELSVSKKILFSNFPDEQLQQDMIDELSEMKPNRAPSLMTLLDVLKSGISKARKSGVGWEKIAVYITEKTGTEVSAEAVSQSYTTMVRERKNKDKSEDDLSYTQLKYRYNTALKILKRHGIHESEVDAYIAEERKKKQDRIRKKEEEEIPKKPADESVGERSETENVVKEHVQPRTEQENRIREDKDLS